MSRFIAILICALCSLTGYSQQDHALDVDGAYSVDNRLQLIKTLEYDTFKLINIRINPTEDTKAPAPSFELKKYSESELPEDSILIVKTYPNWSSFVDSLKKVSYKIGYSYRSEERAHFLEIVSPQYAVMTDSHFNKNSKEWKTLGQTIYKIVPMSLNNGSLIVGLCHLNSTKLEHVLIPTESEVLFARYNKKLYRSSKETIDIDLSYQRDLFNTYRVKKQGKKFVISDEEGEKLVHHKFDRIDRIFPHIVARKGNKRYIYDAHLERMDIPNLRKVYVNQGRVQFIAGSRAGWLNKQGEIVHVPPMPKRSWRCGNVPSLTKTIFVRNDTLMERLVYRSGDLSVSLDSSVVFDKTNTFKKITFPDSSITRWFSAYDRDNLLDSDLYYFQKHNGEQGLLVREEINKEPWFKNRIVLGGKIEEIVLRDYFNPVVFLKDGLWGAYPIMTEGKYLSMTPYDGSLSSVTFKDGTEGWVDLSGKEIRKE